jgi:hypothetical protein
MESPKKSLKYNSALNKLILNYNKILNMKK